MMFVKNHNDYSLPLAPGGKVTINVLFSLLMSTLPLGVIGRLYSLIGAFPGHLFYNFLLSFIINYSFLV